MNIMCPCRDWDKTVNPNVHPCVWVLPWQAAALVARPVQTIHTWRKTGKIDGRRNPVTGYWEVCNCEAATQSANTEARWRKRVG